VVRPSNFQATLAARKGNIRQVTLFPPSPYKPVAHL
jgi:hypothetical protein